MGEIVWESSGSEPFLVGHPNPGSLLFIVESVRLEKPAAEVIRQAPYIYFYKRKQGEVLEIGIDVEETKLDGLTLAVGNLPGTNIQARRIEECLKLARIASHPYVAIKEFDRYLGPAYQINMPWGIELATVTPRLFKKK
ncbi:hypothetical protein HYV80_03260 [Candidatus Woesearchaeota archaeon]|nr:hypothetical protein [Candidatus Woesearchaeota archaeon]